VILIELILIIFGLVFLVPKSSIPTFYTATGFSPYNVLGQSCNASGLYIDISGNYIPLNATIENSSGLSNVRTSATIVINGNKLMVVFLPKSTTPACSPGAGYNAHICITLPNSSGTPKTCGTVNGYTT
jgi:hypothetical protein